MGQHEHEPASAILGTGITRRDFVGATLIGAGAALLSAPCPTMATVRDSRWTGYGGVGDYRLSNGNTAEVVASAHKIRDGLYEKGRTDVIDTSETYDLVVVGGGFAGAAALHEFSKNKPRGTCLLLDNHPIFGGLAKQNEFEVDGYRLAAPQASINFFLPTRGVGDGGQYWSELGIPDKFTFARREDGRSSIAFPKATSSAMFIAEKCASIGYYFQNAPTGPQGTWVKDIWNDDLKRVPWPEDLKRDVIALRDNKFIFKNTREESVWLDSMTYGDFITQVLRLSPEVFRYYAPCVGVVGQSAGTSAYAMKGSFGLSENPRREPLGDQGDKWMSFPGGNSTLLRHFVKAVIPDSIAGPKEFAAIANGAVNFAALDRAGAARRMRLSATTVRVSHDGDVSSADHVNVVYEKGGKLYRVKAKGVILAIGGWIAKRVVADLPSEYRTAFNRFLYSPYLVVNVALRNWRFLDKLGISAARWFDGFGFYASARHPMQVGNRPAPFHPDKPMVLTFYVQIEDGSLPIAAQGPAGRAQLFGTSYADYERQLVTQMQTMFGTAGFNARRDIAGIVLNRWGHPWLTKQPGFFFPSDGSRAPRDVVRQRFGRIAFGHSELSDRGQSWDSATAEGKRALDQVLETI